MISMEQTNDIKESPSKYTVVYKIVNRNMESVFSHLLPQEYIIKYKVGQFVSPSNTSLIFAFPNLNQAIKKYPDFCDSGKIYKALARNAQLTTNYTCPFITKSRLDEYWKYYTEYHIPGNYPTIVCDKLMLISQIH